ncbi:hypothetical protein HWB90_gp065 [Mycobacterium phage Fowlmouth]|uniref:Uncharacterized protein n=2 Tax=Fowlmouthvirus fowlmouth TaxID=2845652 RepID=A0A7G8LPV6_9CAUD|nr:hypothetical protein HWB90_gp065 [Mycobacterium phage Fowlmouth]AYN58015.1 hypothetical protein SEA_FOWLMOUTH_65 [Mycobacterium phage Fowlmouth]QNJ59278.1 hypothetical protein SEA_MRMIYAGI_64 [Mycobacterium phage MrMiyagi]
MNEEERKLIAFMTWLEDVFPHRVRFRDESAKLQLAQGFLNREEGQSDSNIA